jgi:hypothetical protein
MKIIFLMQSASPYAEDWQSLSIILLALFSCRYVKLIVEIYDPIARLKDFKFE